MSACAVLKRLCEELELSCVRAYFSSDFKSGDGWLGNTTRAKICHEKGVLRLIIKYAPADERFRRQILVSELYENEAYFYKSVVPFFSNNSTLFPKFYTSAHTPPQEMIVLEDLKQLCYDMLDYKESNELLNSLLVTYAKFHAMSFIAKVKNPDKFKEIISGLYKNLEPFYDGFSDSIVDQCRRLESLFQMEEASAVLNKLKEFRKDIKNIMTTYNQYHGEHSVIIHGDACINNILMNKQKSTFRLIDFQLTRLGSVVQDLSYLFYTCCDHLQLKNLNHYLLVYHNTLSFELERFGWDSEVIYPFAVLKSEWKQFCRYGLAMTIVVLHGMLSESHEFPDMEQVLKEDRNIFVSLNFISANESIYNDRIRNILNHFVENDFL